MSDYIAQEIQAQILKLLPARSLLRFRCVCKCWKHLIDSPSFLQDHLAIQKPRLILEYEQPEFLVLDPLTLPSFDTLISPTEDEDEDEGEPERLHLVGTLHGVVCLFDNETKILLWNPSIRKLLSFPLPEFMEFDFVDYELGNYSGFWIDPSTKDFKVVIFKLLYGVDADAVLYSSIEKDWKSIPLGDILDCKHLKETPPVVLSGVAYWKAHWKFTNGEENECVDIVLVSFDFESEGFDFIAAPSVDHLWDSNPVLYNWQGELSLVYLDTESSSKCDIYLRRENSWVNVFGFSLKPGIGRGRALWVMKGIEDEMHENSRILATIDRDELVLCDTKGGREALKSGLNDGDDFFLACDFVESLLFP